MCEWSCWKVSQSHSCSACFVCTCQSAFPFPGTGFPAQGSEGSGRPGRLGTRELLPSATGLVKTSSEEKRVSS